MRCCEKPALPLHPNSEQLQRCHAEAYARQVAQVRPLPGAVDLLASLSVAGVRWAIATSGRGEFAQQTVRVLGFDADIPIVTRDQVERAKPDPDLFLAAAARLEADIRASVVVGTAFGTCWPPTRRCAWSRLLSGGYGQDELERAGAYRVYQDPLDLLQHLD